jgi:hypothetical protein
VSDSKNLPSERIQKLLKTVIDHFEDEGESARESQLRTWKKLKLIWEGLEHTWYSEVAHDWRIYEPSKERDEQDYYNKSMNVFKAYLDTIFAALSITVPPIKCYPDDAEEPLDLMTAKAGDKIASLIYRHNDVPLLWLRGLFIFGTEGTVACHTYSKSDMKYGTYTENQYKDVTEEHQIKMCPECQAEISDEVTPEYEAIPELETCPECGAGIAPNVMNVPITTTNLVGVSEEPKSRQIMEMWGGLNFKVANYARNQQHTPYLFHYEECHYSYAIEEYPHLFDKFAEGRNTGSGEDYGRWARRPIQYKEEDESDLVTKRKCWLRPWAFNVLSSEDAKELKRLYKDGVKVCLINEELASVERESLDDHWTLTYNPLADHIHHDPLGMLLVSVQEITSDLISLVLQTIEHGIPQTMADPSVLDLQAYEQLEATPGAIIATKLLSSGKNVKDGFYEVRTATLSSEVMPFFQLIQQLGQLASAAQPSLFGGQLEGSGTASEYSMSRAQALQRLQNVWKVLTIWWKNIFGKVIPQYINDVKDDENDVQLNADGNFINTLIRKSELEGKIGKIELESNENLPITWNQKKDIVMQLMQTGIPEILQTIGAPENMPVLRESIGLIDFHLPGEDSRNKQHNEIKLLLQSEPIQQPPDPMDMEMSAMQGLPEPPPIEVPSVEIDPDFDRHDIEFQVIVSWINSDEGQLAKMENPAGYRNVLLHGRMHKQMLMPPPVEEGSAPTEKPNPKDKPAPIQEENDVNATA